MTVRSTSGARIRPGRSPTAARPEEAQAGSAVVAEPAATVCGCSAASALASMLHCLCLRPSSRRSWRERRSFGSLTTIACGCCCARFRDGAGIPRSGCGGCRSTPIARMHSRPCSRRCLSARGLGCAWPGACASSREALARRAAGRPRPAGSGLVVQLCDRHRTGPGRGAARASLRLSRAGDRARAAAARSSAPRRSCARAWSATHGCASPTTPGTR